MQPDEIKQWLTEEEIKAYKNAIKLGHRVLIRTFESLAATRELMERIDRNTGSDGWVLLSASDLDEIHRALKDVGGE